MSTFQEALKHLKSAKTVVRQTKAGGALKEMWAEAIKVIEDDVKREWSETNAKHRAEANRVRIAPLLELGKYRIAGGSK
ncbi:MAG: hypothetical protein JNM17_04040 [Archangium sp.]|nr:hypothetical protein [Archangium sp.]